MKKLSYIGPLIAVLLVTGIIVWMNRSERVGSGVSVSGQVLLGPTCPVERIPPDPSCAPRPYETSIDIRRAGSNLAIKRIETDANGFFSVQLEPGDYEFEPVGGSPFPMCSKTLVRVELGAVLEVNLPCDTGIR